MAGRMLPRHHHNLLGSGGMPSYLPSRRDAGGFGSSGSRAGRSSESRSPAKTLPVLGHKKAILDAVDKHPIVLIVGETGSGKTTQIPQFLLEWTKQRWGSSTKRRVVCTQPRKVAATSVAHRVAKEMNVNLGCEVGYRVRLDKKLDKGMDRRGNKTPTRLLYMTEGTLLRIAMSDGGLADYSAIIVDEAHERTVDADILMGFLKGKLFPEIYQKEREKQLDREARRRGESWKLEQLEKDKKQPVFDTKVIIMSATLNKEKFQRYFRDPPIIEIPGTLHPITHHWLHQPTEDFMRDIVDTVKSIDDKGGRGDILVFLTGAQEINECVTRINELCGQSVIALPLYAQLNKNRQEYCFKSVQELNHEQHRQARRKCVVSTNIAETSLTIEGIVYVIDSGYSKQKWFHPTKAVETLKVCPISKASVKQRLGRAGRTQEGFIYHMYTWQGYCGLENETQPEVLRCSMVGECLNMLALGVPDPCSFDYIDSPSPLIMARAVTILMNMGAISTIDGTITPKGRAMAKFPVDPKMACAILNAYSRFGVKDELLTIAAMNEENEKIFVNEKDSSSHQSGGGSGSGSGGSGSGGPGSGSSSSSKKNSAKKAKAKFEHIDGDHLTLLNIYNAFSQVLSQCERNGRSSMGGAGGSGGGGGGYYSNNSSSTPQSLKNWCSDNCLNVHTLMRVRSIKDQLQKCLERCIEEFNMEYICDLSDIGQARSIRDINSGSKSHSILDPLESSDPSSMMSSPVERAEFQHPDYYIKIRKALLSGYFNNVATLGHGSKYWTITVLRLTKDSSAVDYTDQCSAHQSSVYAKKSFKRNWVLFDGVVIQHQRQLRMLTAIEPSWLMEIAPHYFNLKLLEKDHSAVSDILRLLDTAGGSSSDDKEHQSHSMHKSKQLNSKSSKKRAPQRVEWGEPRSVEAPTPIVKITEEAREHPELMDPIFDKPVPICNDDADDKKSEHMIAMDGDAAASAMVDNDDNDDDEDGDGGSVDHIDDDDNGDNDEIGTHQQKSEPQKRPEHPSHHPRHSHRHHHSAVSSSSMSMTKERKMKSKELDSFVLSSAVKSEEHPSAHQVSHHHQRRRGSSSLSTSDIKVSDSLRSVSSFEQRRDVYTKEPFLDSGVERYPSYMPRAHQSHYSHSMMDQSSDPSALSSAASEPVKAGRRRRSGKRSAVSSASSLSSGVSEMMIRDQQTTSSMNDSTLMNSESVYYSSSHRHSGSVPSSSSAAATKTARMSGSSASPSSSRDHSVLKQQQHHHHRHQQSHYRHSSMADPVYHPSYPSQHGSAMRVGMDYYGDRSGYSHHSGPSTSAASSSVSASSSSSSSSIRRGYSSVRTPAGHIGNDSRVSAASMRADQSSGGVSGSSPSSYYGSSYAGGGGSPFHHSHHHHSHHQHPPAHHHHSRSSMSGRTSVLSSRRHAEISELAELADSHSMSARSRTFNSLPESYKPDHSAPVGTAPRSAEIMEHSARSSDSVRTAVPPRRPPGAGSSSAASMMGPRIYGH